MGLSYTHIHMFTLFSISNANILYYSTNTIYYVMLYFVLVKKLQLFREINTRFSLVVS